MPRKVGTVQKVKKTKHSISVEDLMKEKEDLESLSVHLEQEYRKANISEKNYQELKEKYEKRLANIEEKIKVLDKTKEPKHAAKKGRAKKQIKKVESEAAEPDTVESMAAEPQMAEPVAETVSAELPVPVEPTEEYGTDFPTEEDKESGKLAQPKVGILGKIKGLFGKRSSRKKEAEDIGTEKGEEMGLGQGGVADETSEEISEEEKLIEQAALAVGAVQEGAASMIEGADEKLAQFRAQPQPQYSEQTSPTGTATAQTVGVGAEGASAGSESGALAMEIEKIRVMIDAIREAKRATDETLHSMAESIGEVRSMVFQTDGSMREITVKMEKIEDQIGEVKPDKIEKKFRDMNTIIERQQLLLEKLNRKSEDLAEKINKVYDMLKGAGGVENLININNEIQKKITNLNDIIKYVERIAFKTEKSYIDLNKRMEDFVLYKTKQEDLEEGVKELIKSVDKVNLELENYSKKSELEELHGDTIGLQKEVTEINKALPVLKAKLPEPINVLRAEREDILLFLENLEESFKSKSISEAEYKGVVNKNKEKLAKINKALRKEWGRLEEYAKIAGVEEAEEKEAGVEEEVSKEDAGEEAAGEAEEVAEVAAVGKEEVVEEEVVEEEAEPEVEKAEVKKAKGKVSKKAEKKPKKRPPSKKKKEKAEEAEEAEEEEDVEGEEVEEKPKKKVKIVKKAKKVGAEEAVGEEAEEEEAEVEEKAEKPKVKKKVEAKEKKVEKKKIKKAVEEKEPAEEEEVEEKVTEEEEVDVEEDVAEGEEEEVEEKAETEEPEAEEKEPKKASKRGRKKKHEVVSPLFKRIRTRMKEYE